MTPVDWRLAAACRGMDPDLFFPTGTEGLNAGVEAKAVCRTCPVRVACLAEGMRHRSGVWGGLSAKERRAIRRRRLAS